MKEEVSVNEKEAWGGLKIWSDHKACVGIRMADNPKRDFGVFSNRITCAGDIRTRRVVRRWLLSSGTMKKIRENTRFSPGIEPSTWSMVKEIRKGLVVRLEVRCAGEYCNAAAYADDLPRKKLDLVDVTDGLGTPCWQVVVEGRNGAFPRVYAEDKLQAWRVFLDYIANELEGKGHIHGE